MTIFKAAALFALPLKLSVTQRMVLIVAIVDVKSVLQGIEYQGIAFSSVKWIKFWKVMEGHTNATGVFAPYSHVVFHAIDSEVSVAKEIVIVPGDIGMELKPVSQATKFPDGNQALSGGVTIM